MAPRLTNPNHRVDYSTTTVPPNYRCFGCQASGCKLWIGYGSLRCIACAAKKERLNITDPDSDHYHELTDFIGRFVPALPKEANNGYWSLLYPYSEAVRWWNKLKKFPPGLHDV